MSPRSGFLALISADILSALGSQVSLVAIPWLVLVTTGSATYTGVIAVAEMIPYLLSSMLLPPIADRLGLRISSVFCDAISAIAVGCIAASHTGFGWLVVLVAIAGGLRGVGDRIKHVLLRPAAQTAGYSMIRVTSLYEGLTRLATLLGAPLGGLLIVGFSARGAVWIDAVSFACCAVTVATMVAAKPADPAAAPAAERYLAALRGGFQYLHSDRVLSTMLGTVFFLNIFGNAATLVFIPVWARDVARSPEALGFTIGAFAAGALVGTLAFTVFADRLPKYPVFLLGALVGSTPRLFVLGLSSNVAVVLVVTVLAGLSIAAVNPILGAAMYERIPDALQTRVIGLCTTISFLGVPIGALAGGWAVSAVGLRHALLGAAVACLVILGLPLLARRHVSLAAPVAVLGGGVDAGS